mgnify:CR=1 FL=1
MIHKPKMLVVDDEPQILESLSQLFELEFNVLTATDGTIGLSLIQHNPDTAVVISDQRMPGMKGVDFLKNVKQFSPDSMRILLTGYADLDAVLDSVNVGEVFRYVRKPWVPDTLKSIVALAMASYMLRRQKAAKAEAQRSAEQPLEKSQTPIVDGIMAQLKPVPQRRRTDPGFQPSSDANPNDFKSPYSIPQRRASDAPTVKSTMKIASKQPICFEEELLAELEAHKAKGDNTAFLSSFSQSALEEIKKFESFEEEFFAKLNREADTQCLSDEETTLFQKAFHGRSGKPKILIVDDEAKVLGSISESLTAFYDVLTCTSADAALDILENNAFIACIVSDMRMPHKSGKEFLLQSQSLAPLVPKILMTAYADADDVVSLLNQGTLFRHVQKPWDAQKLSQILNEAVEECRQRVEVGILMHGITIERGSEVQAADPEPHVQAKQLISSQTTMNTTTMNTLKQLSEFARKSA